MAPVQMADYTDSFSGVIHRVARFPDLLAWAAHAKNRFRRRNRAVPQNFRIRFAIREKPNIPRQEDILKSRDWHSAATVEDNDGRCV